MFKIKTMEKINKQYSMFDLIQAEQAAKIICQRYENCIKNYDGSISQNSEEYNNFKLFNELHSKILDKIEAELLKLK